MTAPPPAMDRAPTLRALADESFDLLVIGGGITGAGVAREASLRYLKQLDFKLVAEAVRERQLLLHMAPHLVEATQFLFPVYRGDPDSLLALRAGLATYDLFAHLRVATPHRILNARDVLQREAQLRGDGLAGGAVYTDSRTDDGRLTLAVLRSAHNAGASVANYVACRAFFVCARWALT